MLKGKGMLVKAYGTLFSEGLGAQVVWSFPLVYKHFAK